jgi:hypothetical protein
MRPVAVTVVAAVAPRERGRYSNADGQSEHNGEQNAAPDHQWGPPSSHARARQRTRPQEGYRHAPAPDEREFPQSTNGPPNGAGRVWGATRKKPAPGSGAGFLANGPAFPADYFTDPVVGFFQSLPMTTMIGVLNVYMPAEGRTSPNPRVSRTKLASASCPFWYTTSVRP